MKKTLLSIITLLVLTISVFAQDNILKQLPAYNAADEAASMLVLAKDAPSSVETLAGMLKPAEAGANNLVEYAINGLTNFATDPANAKYKDAVKEGLENALKKVSDPNAITFLESQLRLFGAFEPKTEAPSQKELLASAKKLAKSKLSNDRCKSMWLYADALGKENASRVIAAMKDKDHAYRMTALHSAEPYADANFYEALVQAYAKAPQQAKNDILFWLGEQKATGQLPFILSQIDGAEAGEAIAAAAKIGGQSAVDRLIACLGTENGPAALKALSAFNGDIRESVLKALPSAEGKAEIALMELASKRHLTEAFPLVLDAVQDAKDADVKAAAVSALKGVVAPADVTLMMSLLDLAPEKYADSFADALNAGIAQVDPNDATARLVFVTDIAKNKERYYAPLAFLGTDQAVKTLSKAYAEGSDKALAALLKADNVKAAPILLKAAQKDENCLSRYMDLVSKYESDASARTDSYINALNQAKNPKIIKKALAGLSSVSSVKALDVIEKYLDDKDVKYEAATAAKKVATEVYDKIPFSRLENIFGKVSAIFRATGDADDGYAVDEMKEFLSKVKSQN